MRLGVFGGSFDPVHYGHLLLAEYSRESARLDRVLFMPAAVPPHKQQKELASDKQRIEMLKLAIAGHDAFEVSDLEISRGGVSYTVDTLSAVRARFPHAELFFLMGADSLEEFPTWRSPEQICELAIPMVVRRPGSAPPDVSALSAYLTADRLQQARDCRVDMPLIELSSTEIRRRVAAGCSICFQTPRAVEQYIKSAGLYAPA